MGCRRPLRLWLAIALAVGALALPTAQAGARFEGLLAEKSAADTTWDPANEDIWSNQLFAYASAAAAWGFDYGAVVSGLIEYRHDIGDETSGKAIYELRELYGKIRVKNFDLFLGQQIVSWGMTDFVSPLDLLNPTDYSRVLDQELAFSRLGTVMIRPVVYLGPVQLEGAFIPLFTPSRYEVVGGDWALVRQTFPTELLLRALRKNDDWQRLENAVALWVPNWRGDLREVLSDPEVFADHTDIPDQDLTAPEGAVRVKYTSSAVDLQAAYYALWDDIPTLHINPLIYEMGERGSRTSGGYSVLPPPQVLTFSELTNPFTLTHHRVQSAGLGFTTILADITWRGEGIVDFDRYTYRTDLEAVRRDQARWTFNVEHTFPHNVMIEGLLLEGYIFDREDDFLARAWTHMVGVGGRTTFLHDRLTVEALAVLDLTYLNGADWRSGDIFASGWTLDPQVTYAILDPLKITAGANLLGGDDETIIGNFEGNSRVFATLQYGF